MLLSWIKDYVGERTSSTVAESNKAAATGRFGHLRIPLSLDRNETTPTLILLHSAQLLRQKWQLEAISAGHTILTFQSDRQLEHSVARLDCLTPIYVDADLGGANRGIEVADELKQSGFKVIFLVSNGVPIDLSDCSSVRGIQSHELPDELFS